MTSLAIIVLCAIALFALGDLVMVCGFVWVFRKTRPAEVPAEWQPKTAVILCLRGPDPFLDDCITALLDQDYANYGVRIIVDSRQDPAWEIAQEIVDRCPMAEVSIEELRPRRATCSLKCSSVLQAFDDLDESYEVAALLDADTIPHRTWLRELVAPLAQPDVGATTGNRWYLPVRPTCGSLVRHAWNAAAVVQMYFYHIPWGGTLALKLDVFRHSDLADRWAHAFCEDTMLYEVVQRRVQRVQFVPSLMMVNRETCTLGGFYHWVRRQLLAARLYHPGWLTVAVHGILTSLAPLLALGLLLAGIAAGNAAAAWSAAAALAVSVFSSPLLLILLERAVAQVIRRRGEPTRWLSAAGALKLFAAILLTKAVYLCALLSAIFVRAVHWRGIGYRIHGPWQIRITDDRPYEAVPEAVAGSRSL